MRAVALVAAAMVIAAACGGGGSDPKTKSADSTTTTLAPPIAPLTGLLDPSGESHGRAALTVKIGNTATARPQSGLDVADVVYEEVVEGGITRLAAVFNSETPESIGPIRSVRPVDAAIAQPLGGLFAYSGGIPSEVDRIESVPGLIAINEDTAGEAMFRERDRSAPHNLYASAAALWEIGGEPVPPAPLFDYLGADEPATAGEAVGSFTVGLTRDAGYNPTYSWDGETAAWLRSVNGEPSIVASGARIAPQNVIVQFTTYDPAPGATGAVGRLTGSGPAWVFSAGQIVRGTWTRDDLAGATRYADSAGRAIELTPGRTWVSLAAFGADTQIVATGPAPTPESAG